MTLSRATLPNWVIQCAQTWLKPLYRHMKQVLLEEPLIHADETVVQVLKEEGKAATSESRMWLYASGETSRKGIRLFEYQPDRSGKRPASFLSGFAGYLVTDGYAGYNQVQGVTHLRLLGACQTEMAGCHAGRRHGQDQPGGRGLPVLHQAIYAGEEILLRDSQESLRVPPECGSATAGGVFLLAENGASGERQ